MNYNKRDYRSKACVSPPGWTYGLGSKCQNATLAKHGHVAYQIKRNHECSSMVANILLANPYQTPGPDLGVWVKRSKFNFSEHGHVAYQLKENHRCSNMVANALPADPSTPTSTLRMSSIGRNSFFFRTWSCCISNYKRITNAATCYQIFCSQNHLPSS